MNMLLTEILTIYDLIDQPGKPGQDIVNLFKNVGVKDITIHEVNEKKGSTECIKIRIEGKKKGKGNTLGIIGRLGGVGARPDVIGLVSDGDGALTALSVALKLAKMSQRGDQFDNDILIATHICTAAPTTPHEPVPFMGSPIALSTMNKYEVDKEMAAILSIDTSRGNKIININGFAITPTVKEGWILQVSDDLLRIMEYTTGKLPAVVPITMQDITPYGNGVYHFNSIMQPVIATSAPVVGVAIVSEVPVPGCSTGISNAFQIDQVGRFVIEVAQGYSKGNVNFYNRNDFKTITSLYGKMNHLQKNPVAQS